MKTQCLISLLVVCAIWKQTAAVTSCYKCSSTIGIDGVEKNALTTDTGSCASLSGKSTTDNTGDYGCKTTFTTSGGYTTITREGTTIPIADIVKGCTIVGDATTCYCATDKCNSETVAASMAYDCYECQSAEYFDNGCGEKLNTGSAFVRTVKGCSACYKNVAMQADHSIQYYRGCTRSVAIDDHCTGEETELTGRTCGCKGALCNSADTVALKSVTAFTAVVLSAVVKLMC